MEQFFKDFFVQISPALQTLLVSIVTLATGMATAWLKSKWDVEKVNLSAQQQYLLRLVVSAAVDAANQVKVDNKEKLAYAFDVAEKALAGYGVTVDIDVIYAAIEAQVLNSKKGDTFLAQPG